MLSTTKVSSPAPNPPKPSETVPPCDGKYHKLRVTLARAGDCRVTARPGYVAERVSERVESAQERIHRIVLSSDLLNQVPATVSVSSSATSNCLYRIQVNSALARGSSFLLPLYKTPLATT